MKRNLNELRRLKSIKYLQSQNKTRIFIKKRSI